MALTRTAVRYAKPSAKDYTLPDDNGLALFVNTKGAKCWHFRFSWAGKQPRISLGTYPEISLRDARTRVLPGAWPRKTPKKRLFSIESGTQS